MDEASAYRELGASIMDLINLTISKFQNIVTMRGMIMQETSSLDLKMDNIVKAQLKTLNFQMKSSQLLKIYLIIFLPMLKKSTTRLRQENPRTYLEIIFYSILLKKYSP